MLTPLKDLSELELIDALYSELNFEGEEQLTLERAVEFARTLHKGQVRRAPIKGRSDTPYIEHPLRNTLRLVRWGVRDSNILLASLLHDTVEDCGENFIAAYTSEEDVHPYSAREMLSSYIGLSFGEAVKYIVMGVTNPYYSSKEWRAFSVEQRHEIYYTTVSHEIRSAAEIFLVKLSDYIDNAGSLHWTPVAQSHIAQRLSKKYYPLLPLFLEYLHRHSLEAYVSAPAIGLLDEKLQKIDLRLSEILEEA